jgi:hypothetical protein
MFRLLHVGIIWPSIRFAGLFPGEQINCGSSLLVLSSSVDLSLAELSSRVPRAKYAIMTLYLPVRLAYQFRGVAGDGGWELGDLARALILAGLGFSMFRLSKDELASETRLTYAVGELNRLTTGTVRRPYETGLGNRRGSWITIRLPEGFLKFLSMYARSSGRSRNAALKLFLKAGLLIYLTGYNKFLGTIIAETESRLTGSGSVHKAA